MYLFLCGGGGCEKHPVVTKKMIEVMDHSKPILYIPLADDHDVFPKQFHLDWIAGELAPIENGGIDMVSSFEELAEVDLNKYGVLYIGGGNTYQLIKGIKEFGIYNKILDYLNNGGVVNGSSAGAVIFGKNVDAIASMDDNIVGLSDFTAFDFADGYSIFPHYMNYSSSATEDEKATLRKKYTDALIDFTRDGEKVFAIPEEDAVFVSGDGVCVIGDRPYYIFKDGKYEEFQL